MAAVGLVLLVVGLVLLTVAAPPQQVGGSAEAGPLLVTAPGALALTGRAVEVEVDGEAFVGLGRADEVDAWLDGVGATQVDGVATETTLLTSERPGGAADAVVPPADPALADVWQEEQVTDGASVRLDEPRAEQVLVVSAPAGRHRDAHLGPARTAPRGLAARRWPVRWRPCSGCCGWPPSTPAVAVRAGG